MTGRPWIESDDEFEGVGAHRLNPRFDDVDDDESAWVAPQPGRRVQRLSSAAATVAVDLSTYVRRLDGHDGSHWQVDAGPVDWNVLVDAVWWFAWKATQSTRYVDPTFAAARRQADRRAGFRHRLPYHWLSSTTDPEQQADHHLRTVGEPGPWGSMLDAEENGITVDSCLGWLEYFEARRRRPAAVYSGLYVAGGTIWRSERIREGRFGPRPMILAAYVSRENLLARMRSLGVAHLPMHAWQYSSAGPVPGITGRADMNAVFDRAVFDRICGIEAARPEPVPPHLPVPPGEPHRPLPSPVPIPEEGPVIRVVFSGYTNQFSHDGGKYSHITQEIAAAYDKAPLVAVNRALPGGAAAFKSALADSHLDAGDLTSVGG